MPTSARRTAPLVTLRRGDPCGRPPIAPRQGTRALPYKVLRYRARADRVVRPYKHFRKGDPCHVPPHTKTSPLFFPAPCFAPANVL